MEYLKRQNLHDFEINKAIGVSSSRKYHLSLLRKNSCKYNGATRRLPTSMVGGARNPAERWGPTGGIDESGTSEVELAGHRAGRDRRQGQERLETSRLAKGAPEDCLWCGGSGTGPQGTWTWTGLSYRDSILLYKRNMNMFFCRINFNHSTYLFLTHIVHEPARTLEYYSIFKLLPLLLFLFIFDHSFY
jgi:hypothetical protein